MSQKQSLTIYLISLVFPVYVQHQKYFKFSRLDDEIY